MSTSEERLDILRQKLYAQADGRLRRSVEDCMNDVRDYTHRLGNGLLTFELPEVNQSAQKTTVQATPLELLAIVQEFLIAAGKDQERDRVVQEFLRDVAVDSRGRIYVADTVGLKISVFAPVTDTRPATTRPEVEP